MNERMVARIKEDIYQEVDGFYVWAPRDGSGFCDSHYLRLIADILDEMNTPWQADINAYFEQHRDKDATNGMDGSIGSTPVAGSSEPGPHD